MQLQPDIFPVAPEEFPRVVEVWEASVRATHHFMREEDIQSFRPLVRDGLPKTPTLVCVRDTDGLVAGFLGVADSNVNMLFIHPEARGRGAGRRLLTYAVTALGATTLDVYEQNGQALGFYLRMGFEVAGRSERDSAGRPYPVLHMRLACPAESSAQTG